MSTRDSRIDYAKQRLEHAHSSMRIFWMSLNNGDKPQWVAFWLCHVSLGLIQAMLAVYVDDLAVARISKMEPTIALDMFRRNFIGSDASTSQGSGIFAPRHYAACTNTLLYWDACMYGSCEAIVPTDVLRTVEVCQEMLDIVDSAIGGNLDTN